MKRLIALAALLLVSSVAFAAPSITIQWVNPTTTTAGGPLTGTDILTKFQLFISNSPLTTLPATPTTELTAISPLQTEYVYAAVSGQTVYVRMKACNATGCSDATGQVSAVVPFPAAVPGSPQNVVIRVTL